MALFRFHGTTLCLSFLLGVSSLAVSQTLTVSDGDPPQSSSATRAEPAAIPEVSDLSPVLPRFNAGITFSSYHESATGWATLATPAVGYRFNNTFSVDATLPIYFYRLAESRSRRPRPNARLVNQRGELGDVVLGFHAQFQPRPFEYQATVAVTAPSGDEAYGLTSGRVTFDLNNHFERTYGRFTPNVEIGAGDSSTLVNRQVNKIYTSLGPLAHFQIGIGAELLRGIFFECDTYEQLPIGDQKIYSAYRAHRPTVVTGYNVTEDNGFTNSLDIPIDANTTFSGYYSRSLRRYTDTAAVGITYVLRAPRPVEEEPSIDDLLR
ncbi:hypothetical protein [Edaphobacter bradus]|uniref:hypothetical protein n=1 Tax=Edaphobacter bradus TaxID=2259016 RepID=UPI0021E0EC1A|nr:hypothetical protein [Edaphobacter bradus]